MLGLLRYQHPETSEDVNSFEDHFGHKLLILSDHPSLYYVYTQHSSSTPTLFHNLLQLDGGDAVSLLMDSPIELSLARTKGTRKHPHQATKTTHKSLFGNTSLEALISVTILSS